MSDAIHSKAEPWSHWYVAPFEFLTIDDRRPLFTGYVILSALICYFLFFPLRGTIAPSVANLYLGYIDTGSVGDSLDVGKDYIALIYFFLDQYVPYWVFTVTFVVIYYVLISWRANNIQTALVHAVIAFQLLAYSFYITKESVLVAIGITTFTLHYLGYHRIAQTFFILALSVFAVFVRPYYAPIVAFALMTQALGWRRALLMGAIGGALGILLVPEILDKLYQAKEQMNIATHFRFHSSSVLPLFLSARTPLGFWWDYLRSLFYIATPMLWLFGAKAVYAQVHFIFLMCLTVAAFHKGRRMYVAFAIGVMGVMAYVVPDMGTWIRHSTAEAVFLYMSIMTRRGPAQDKQREFSPIAVGTIPLETA